MTTSNQNREMAQNGFTPDTDDLSFFFGEKRQNWVDVANQSMAYERFFLCIKKRLSMAWQRRIDVEQKTCSSLPLIPRVRDHTTIWIFRRSKEEKGRCLADEEKAYNNINTIITQEGNLLQRALQQSINTISMS